MMKLTFGAAHNERLDSQRLANKGRRDGVRQERRLYGDTLYQELKDLADLGWTKQGREITRRQRESGGMIPWLGVRAERPPKRPASEAREIPPLEPLPPFVLRDPVFQSLPEAEVLYRLYKNQAEAEGLRFYPEVALRHIEATQKAYLKAETDIQTAMASPCLTDQAGRIYTAGHMLQMLDEITTMVQDYAEGRSDKLENFDAMGPDLMSFSMLFDGMYVNRFRLRGPNAGPDEERVDEAIYRSFRELDAAGLAEIPSLKTTQYLNNGRLPDLSEVGSGLRITLLGKLALMKNPPPELEFTFR